MLAHCCCCNSLSTLARSGRLGMAPGLPTHKELAAAAVSMSSVSAACVLLLVLLDCNSLSHRIMNCIVIPGILCPTWACNLGKICMQYGSYNSRKVACISCIGTYKSMQLMLRLLLYHAQQDWLLIPLSAHSVLVADRALAGASSVFSLTRQCSQKDKLYLQIALPLGRTCPLAWPQPQHL